ncbi:MAG TPA: adenosine nucleotide hydrolase, partial [Firmicutes bacterium]|nr:adenosine nucleotide hydrolase [Bacillota bacterium]
GADIRYLVTTYSGNDGRTRGHGFPLELVQAQAQALGAELVAVETEWEDYETRFKDAIRELRARGVEKGIYGDIDMVEHREWVERVTAEAGLTAWLPLWGENQGMLLREWEQAGFTALIVAMRYDLGLGWLGRPLDHRCLGEIESALAERGLSPSGESGEYHTLVVDGPAFGRPLQIKEAVPVLRDRHWVLDIRQW